MTGFQHSPQGIEKDREEEVEHAVNNTAANSHIRTDGKRGLSSKQRMDGLPMGVF